MKSIFNDERNHCWGAILPTVKEAEDFAKSHGLEIQCRGKLRAYNAKVLFATANEGRDVYEIVVPDGCIAKNVEGIKKLEDINTVYERVRTLGA